MMEDLARELASKSRALVVASAGCGKTELIVRAVASTPTQRQLVLTHTHAGVRALRERLRKVGVAPGACRVETIDGFALRYAAAFPRISSCEVTKPYEGCDWVSVRESCKRAFDNRHIQHVFKQSYAGFYVDEYQDCSVSQHELILRLAELRKCRVVGDPMQAVFGFDRNDPLPRWSDDVLPQFERLDDLTKPYRWYREGANEQLGKWLADVRSVLEGTGRLPPLQGTVPVRWVSPTVDGIAQVNACLDLSQACGSDTVVAIHNFPQQAHSVAKRLNGCFQSLEEVESRDLMQQCELLEKSSGRARAARVIEAACMCIVKMPKYMKSVRRSLKTSGLPTRGKVVTGCPELLDALREVESEDSSSFTRVADCLDVIASMPDVRLYRRELFRDIQKTCRQHDAGVGLKTTAWEVRDVARRHGRRLPRRLVARTLIIKGLEFDHAVVLNADEIRDPKNLYVALTRASKSLTVVTRDTSALFTNGPASSSPQGARMERAQSVRP